uniref:G_PROTEIN_RECEP_F1_2 domain-containing protein n=1 Tax=Panagrellus redivivus TaxID=6233 RepID=A0A7E4VER4_PANRE
MNVVMMLAIFGNLFLVFVIWRGSRMTKNKISPVQLLLLHTCVADILYAILALGTEVAIIMSFPHFYGGDWLCKLVKYLQAFPMYASAFLLVAISADRYQAICRPLAHYRSDRYRRPNYLATAAWCLALICSLPQFYFWELKQTSDPMNMNQTRQICATIFENHELLRKAYIVYFSTVAWLLPSMTAAGFYYFVCKTVWLSKCTVERVPSYTDDKTESSEKVSHRTRDYVNKLRKKSLGLRNQTSEFGRKRIQTVRLTLIIIACNFFLWAPYCLMNTVLAFVPEMGDIYRLLITYILILGNLNSCVNPWIYILFNRRMTRKALAFPTTSHTPVRLTMAVSEFTTASTHPPTAYQLARNRFSLPCNDLSPRFYTVNRDQLVT